MNNRHDTTAARDAMFRRIRQALGPVGQLSNRESYRAQDYQEIPREFRRTSSLGRDELLALFQARVQHYNAPSYVAPAGEVSAIAGRVLSERGKQKMVVPRDFPQAWLPDSVTPLIDDGLSNDQLEHSDGVMTACTVAVASTGTIVLASGYDGRRAITLVPDYQLCFVRRSQIVEFIPEALIRLQDRKTAPLTFFSGPSATVDIEMTRVKGVHGPRSLDVIIVDE